MSVIQQIIVGTLDTDSQALLQQCDPGFICSSLWPGQTLVQIPTGWRAELKQSKGKLTVASSGRTPEAVLQEAASMSPSSAPEVPTIVMWRVKDDQGRERVIIFGSGTVRVDP